MRLSNCFWLSNTEIELVYMVHGSLGGQHVSGGGAVPARSYHSEGALHEQ